MWKHGNIKDQKRIWACLGLHDKSGHAWRGQTISHSQTWSSLTNPCHTCVSTGMAWCWSSKWKKERCLLPPWATLGRVGRVSTTSWRYISRRETNHSKIFLWNHGQPIQRWELVKIKAPNSPQIISQWRLYSLLRDVSIPNHHHGQVVVSLAKRSSMLGSKNLKKPTLLAKRSSMRGSKNLATPQDAAGSLGVIWK